jgi:hypothetical protein
LGSWDPPNRFGFVVPRGVRTRGIEITIEVGTTYVELGATATDNLKEPRALTRTIQTHAVGPLKHIEFAQRAYPVYTRDFMINLAYAKYKLEVGPTVWVEAQEIIDMGLVQDGETFARQQLENCRKGVGSAQVRSRPGFFAEGEPYSEPLDITQPEYDGTAPNYCGFVWADSTTGLGPGAYQTMTSVVFNVSYFAAPYEDGYEYPCTLTKDQPHIEFDEVNFRLPGVYNVTYDVSDDFNNTARTVSRTVTVKDTTPPVLHLEGEPIMFVRYGEEFVDPGATATDTGDDYYYELNRMSISACGFDQCTTEHVNKSINDKIVTRVHHERLECERVAVYAPVTTRTMLCEQTPRDSAADIVLTCPQGSVISGYKFISFGQPQGDCASDGPFRLHETCALHQSAGADAADVAVFMRECLGHAECTLSNDATLFGVDPCPGEDKWLTVHATCDLRETWNVTANLLAQ